MTVTIDGVQRNCSENGTGPLFVRFCRSQYWRTIQNSYFIRYFLPSARFIYFNWSFYGRRASMFKTNFAVLTFYHFFPSFSYQFKNKIHGTPTTESLGPWLGGGGGGCRPSIIKVARVDGNNATQNIWLIFSPRK